MKKNLLITGGSGFLGKYLAKKIIEDKNYKNYNIIIASRNNEKNYAVSSFLNCYFCPMDVSNIESVRDAFYRYKPEIIIHAAATKFVQLSEKFPFETIETNIVGTLNVKRVSAEIKSKIVIGISTDKSAQPIENLYGFSKAIGERILLTKDNNTLTKFICVRFGNIAWSTNSVLPIWKRMLDTGKTISTTGPEMKRFFFSIDEATDLVIRAIRNANKLNGKILVIKMKAAFVRDILHVFSKIYNAKWKKIKSRVGDKIHEYLVSENELPFTYITRINNINHYVISLNEKVSKPLKKTYSTKNSLKLSKTDIKRLILDFDAK